MQSGVPIRHEFDLHTNLELFLIPDKRFDIQWLLWCLSVDDRCGLLSTKAVRIHVKPYQSGNSSCGRWPLAVNIIEICRRVRVKIVVYPFVMITRVVNCNFDKVIVGFSIAHQTHHQSCVVVLVCLLNRFSVYLWASELSTVRGIKPKQFVDGKKEFKLIYSHVVHHVGMLRYIWHEMDGI